MNGSAQAHGRSEGATIAPSHPGNEAIDALVVEALDYQAEAFDHDEPVDGGDLVEWFAAWRVAVRLARGAEPKTWGEPAAAPVVAATTTVNPAPLAQRAPRLSLF